MAPKKAHDDGTEPDGDFLEEYVNAEATQDLEQRQDLDQVGRQALRRRLHQAGSGSSRLSGGDVDAVEDGSGEEAVGGENPTPDQDVVDEIGKSAGLTYQDDEPLNYNKVTERDRHRWELDPASAEDDESLDLDEDDEDEDEDDELSLLDGDIDTGAIEVVDEDGE